MLNYSLTPDEDWVYSNFVKATGGSYGAASQYQTIKEHYAEPQRFYHTWRHIEYAHAKMVSFESFKDLDPIEQINAFFALLYHDIVYVPGYHRNEFLSALKFMADANTLGSGQRRIKIMTAIQDTDHLWGPTTEISPYVLDADLYGLSDEIAYWDNNGLVRREFGMYSDDQWAIGRKAFLESFLAKPQIYFLEENQDRNDMAREILTKELEMY